MDIQPGNRTAPPNRVPGAGLLLTGIAIATCMDAINGTALGVSRGQIMGGLHTDPDALVWLDAAYLASKLAAFPLAAWMVARFGYVRALIGTTLLLIIVSPAAGLSGEPTVVAALRALQGAGGAILLVAGQAVLFGIFPRGRQPMAQAVFALAAVMAPNALAPALQGRLGDTLSWSWMFYANLPIGLLGLAFIVAGAQAAPRSPDRSRFDAVGMALLLPAMFALVYVLQNGERWDWFGAPRIVVLATCAGSALAAFLAWQVARQGRGALIDLRVLGNSNFAFGFVVSFVAGFALFGSSLLIPAFTQAVLHYPAPQAGLVLLPAGALIAAGLLGGGALLQTRWMPGMALVPLGIGLFMFAMWLFAGLVGHSAPSDLGAPLLTRGLGLGFLFVTLSVLTLTGLDGDRIVHGVGLFNTGRQIGGLLGLAFVQTSLDERAAYHRSVLAAHLTPANPPWVEAHARIAQLLAAGGLTPGQAAHAATGLLQGSLQTQAAVLSFNDAFLALAAMFVLATPVLIAFKVTHKRLFNPQENLQ